MTRPKTPPAMAPARKVISGILSEVELDIGHHVRLVCYVEYGSFEGLRRILDVALDDLRAESYAPDAEAATEGRLGGVMRVIGRLLLALAVAFPVAVLFTSVAGAGGPAVLKCMSWEDADGAIAISPGVGNTPANQSVTVHGKMFSCNKAGGGAQFSANMQMSSATCGDLAMSGTASFAWGNGSHSTAYLQFQPQALEPNKVVVTGVMTSGMFQGLLAQSQLRYTQVFDGSGANCSPSNLLRHIEYINSRSFQLLTPDVTTTTQPTATTQPRVTTPTSFPTTVPITNLGGPTTSPQTSGPPIRVIVQAGPPFNNGGTFISQPQFPQGTLAFTGSRSGTAAMFGFEALLVGGALAAFGPERRRRRLAQFAYNRPKAYLHVTLPPMR